MIKNKKTKKLVLIITLAIIIITLIVASVMIIIKNQQVKEKEQPTEQNEEVDVSNITENVVIEGASRNLKVLNDEDASKIISEMYIQACDRYSFDFDTEVINGEGNYYKLVGYDKIMNNMFTSNGKNQFEEYYKDIIIKQDKNTYLKDLKYQKDDFEYDFSIKNKSIEEKVITCDISSTFLNVDGESIQKNNKFIIVKENGIWKIESFVPPFDNK